VHLLLSSLAVDFCLYMQKQRPIQDAVNAILKIGEKTKKCHLHQANDTLQHG
jgi:hypothetical protein